MHWLKQWDITRGLATSSASAGQPTGLHVCACDCMPPRRWDPHHQCPEPRLTTHFVDFKQPAHGTHKHVDYEEPTCSFQHGIGFVAGQQEVVRLDIPAALL